MLCVDWLTNWRNNEAPEAEATRIDPSHLQHQTRTYQGSGDASVEDDRKGATDQNRW